MFFFYLIHFRYAFDKIDLASAEIFIYDEHTQPVESYLSVFKKFIVVCAKPEAIIPVDRLFPLFRVAQPRTVYIGNSVDVGCDDIGLNVAPAQIAFLSSELFKQIVFEFVLLPASRFFGRLFVPDDG